jgi:hypothetical protein
VASFPDGSASAPSITNTGNTNTGLFHPADDTLAISTGGTERMRVDSSGRVGIGVTPAQRFHVYGVAARALVESPATSDAIFAAKTNSGEWLFGSGIGVAANVFNIFQLTGTSIERLRIDGNGLITGTGTSLGAWTSYTPTLGGTGWAIGNGTITGRYCQIGKIVHYVVAVTFGSTSTFGAGALNVSLPVTSGAVNQTPHGTGMAQDASASQLYAIAIRQSTSTTATLRTLAQPDSGIFSTTLFTWADTDVIRIIGTYEAA